MTQPTTVYDGQVVIYAIGTRESSVCRVIGRQPPRHWLLRPLEGGPAFKAPLYTLHEATLCAACDEWFYTTGDFLCYGCRAISDAPAARQVHPAELPPFAAGS